ncbi:hypothetical protein [Flavobacterium sp.]|uniref:hypothetical protein n=1 Tax=Flavobacterium sp. TaxID=239 RepID=UPI00374CA460
MAESIYFKKENNGNVTIREVIADKIIYSLQPNQNVTKDISNNNNIIIKSAIGNNQDRGIVINIEDINPFMSLPPFPSASLYGRSLLQPYVNIDNYIIDLINNFFFEVSSNNNSNDLDGGTIS